MRKVTEKQVKIMPNGKPRTTYIDHWEYTEEEKKEREREEDLNSPITLDELIEKLKEIRLDVSGDVPIVIDGHPDAWGWKRFVNKRIKAIRILPATSSWEGDCIELDEGHKHPSQELAVSLNEY